MICSWARLIIPNVSETGQSPWSRSSVFTLEKWSKYLDFQSFFLPLIDLLVATFNETRAPTSRKYVSEQAIVMPNWSKTFQTFWSHSFIFALENNLKIKISRDFLPIKNTSLDTFSETRALTSRKHVSEQSIVMSNWSIKFQTFWSHSSAFPLEKQPKNINFQSFFYL